MYMCVSSNVFCLQGRRPEAQRRVQCRDTASEHRFKPLAVPGSAAFVRQRHQLRLVPARIFSICGLAYGKRPNGAKQVSRSGASQRASDWNNGVSQRLMDW
jgi:hypothetical protein